MPGDTCAGFKGDSQHRSLSVIDKEEHSVIRTAWGCWWMEKIAGDETGEE